MFYEANTKVTRVNEKGEDKPVIERYVIRNCESFKEAEERAAHTYADYQLDGDVVAIKRSNLYEIVNENANKEKYFRAKLGSVFVDDNGKEKMTYYHVLLSADNMDEAQKIMKEYMNQGMSDFILLEVKETKYNDVV